VLEESDVFGPFFVLANDIPVVAFGATSPPWRVPHKSLLIPQPLQHHLALEDTKELLSPSTIAMKITLLLALATAAIAGEIINNEVSTQ
jgi:hypothetical protein